MRDSKQDWLLQLASDILKNVTEYHKSYGFTNPTCEKDIAVQIQKTLKTKSLKQLTEVIE